MNTNIDKYIRDGIRHRYLTDIGVGKRYSGVICDTLAPTYMADDLPIDDNGVLTISPFLAKMMGTSSIPFNKFLSIADINMKLVKENFKKIKKKNMDIVIVGYGGMNLNVVHFMSLLAYRVGVDQPFNFLCAMDKDFVSTDNLPRFYKDLTGLKFEMFDRLRKVYTFDEKNLAKSILVDTEFIDNQYLEYLKRELENPVFFGAPDFDTRKMLEDENFLFAGHGGDSVVLYKNPKVDSDLTSETYGTVNLASFFINILKVTEATISELANGVENRDIDTKLFGFNSKKHIQENWEKVEDVDSSVAVYERNNLRIII